MKSFSIAVPFRLTAFAILLTPCPSASAKTITFSGFDWEIRSSEKSSGPGPNRWDENNVSVDADGHLHLKLTERGGRWYCAEVTTQKALGFGRYQFQIVGRVDRLDPNVVFGLFNYPEPEVGPDGTNEIDIEFSRWGHASAPIGNYTVWPVRAALGQSSHSFPMSLGDDGPTTHSFAWSPTGVLFRSDAAQQKDPSKPLGTWHYQPKDANDRIARKPMPVHINLWCFEGRQPRNGKPVELVVRSFTFTPEK